MTAIPARVRKIVLERAGDVCEGCGHPVANNLHHRKYRSRGGKHVASNLVLLCGSGTTGCHARAHSANPPAGWSVNSWGNPTLIPFESFWGPVWLDDHGGVHDATNFTPF